MCNVSTIRQGMVFNQGEFRAKARKLARHRDCFSSAFRRDKESLDNARSRYEDSKGVLVSHIVNCPDCMESGEAAA